MILWKLDEDLQEYYLINNVIISKPISIVHPWYYSEIYQEISETELMSYTIYPLTMESVRTIDSMVIGEILKENDFGVFGISSKYVREGVRTMSRKGFYFKSHETAMLFRLHKK